MNQSEYRLLIRPHIHPVGELVRVTHPVTGEFVDIEPRWATRIDAMDRPFRIQDLVDSPVDTLELQLVVDALAARGLLKKLRYQDLPEEPSPLPFRFLDGPSSGLVLGFLVLGLWVRSPTLLAWMKTFPTWGSPVFLLATLFSTAILPIARVAVRAQISGTVQPIRMSLRGSLPVLGAEHISTQRAAFHASGFIFDLLTIHLTLSLLETLRGMSSLDANSFGVDACLGVLAASSTMLLAAIHPLAKYDAYAWIQDLLGLMDLRAFARSCFLDLRHRHDAKSLVFAAYYGLTILHLFGVSAAVLVLAFLASASLAGDSFGVHVTLFSALAVLILRQSWLVAIKPIFTPRPAISRPDVSSTFETNLKCDHGEMSPSGLGFTFIDRQGRSLGIERFRLELRLIFGARGDLRSTPRSQRGELERAWTERLRPRFPTHDYLIEPGGRLFLGSRDPGLIDLVARREIPDPEILRRALSSAAGGGTSVEFDEALLTVTHRATQKIVAIVFVELDPANRASRIEALSTAMGRTATPRREVLSAALESLRKSVPSSDRDAFIRARGLTLDFIDAHCVVPIFRMPALDIFDPEMMRELQRIGFLTHHTRSGRTIPKLSITHPSVVFPVGLQEPKTSIKARSLLPGISFDNERMSIGRFQKYRTFASDSGPAPLWSRIIDKEVFVFDGELKAMAFSSLTGRSACATGGLSFAGLSALAEHIRTIGSENVIVVVDRDSSDKYRAQRSDGLTDAFMRAIQLGRMLEHIPSKVVFGPASEDGTKADLDELVSRPSEAQKVVSELQANAERASNVTVLLSASEDLPGYVDELNRFAAEMAAALRRRHSILLSEDPTVWSAREWSEHIRLLEMRRSELLIQGRRLGPALQNVMRGVE